MWRVILRCDAKQRSVAVRAEDRSKCAVPGTHIYKRLYLPGQRAFSLGRNCGPLRRFEIFESYNKSTLSPRS